MFIWLRLSSLRILNVRNMSLDKNPGIRPIGVGEVLRRIIGKTISAYLKKEIKLAAGPLQVCAGHCAGAEAAIHAMAQIFYDDGTDGIMLVDASNAFNQMNRAVAMHNIQITCPECPCISSTRTEVPRDCSSVDEKRSYPRKGQHKVTLWPCHGMRSTHPS